MIHVPSFKSPSQCTHAYMINMNTLNQFTFTVKLDYLISILLSFAKREYLVLFFSPRNILLKRNLTRYRAPYNDHKCFVHKH